MTSSRDSHVRVLPLHVANKIAAGEVVERPASVVKELVENAVDAGASRISVAVTQGGRKLVAVQDDGCGMEKDDAVLSLERQATSKIRDVSDIEEIDTLGFRGEAIPSIASVSRFSMTTRRADSDEGTFIQVNAGTLAEVRSAGCPPGTRVEVRDLFCNVPARRKFLRAYATEESHVKNVFTVHALAHPQIAFSLSVDGRELYRLAPASSVRDRIRDIFGPDFLDSMLPLSGDGGANRAQVRVTGFIERPNLSTPTRRDQYVFVNGRPATASSIAYALREAYPRRPGDVRPAAVVFIDLPPGMVDVNVHPTKREVRFRDNVAVREAIMAAVSGALAGPAENFELQTSNSNPQPPPTPANPVNPVNPFNPISSPNPVIPAEHVEHAETLHDLHVLHGSKTPPTKGSPVNPVSPPAPTPLQHEIEFAADPNSPRTKPWQWFRFLAQSASGYLLVETDSGIVTINPHAARERIAYEKLLSGSQKAASQALLIPETVKMSPVDSARISASLEVMREMGFQVEPFGTDTFKIDAVPQILGSLSPSAVLATAAHDLAESGSRRGGDRWREELIAKSVAKSFAGASLSLTPDGATKLVEELCACRMPYVCPRGKPVMIFTSTRELDRKFARS